MATPQKRTLQDGSIRWLLQVRKKGYKCVNITRKTKAAAEKEARRVTLAMENGTWDEFAIEQQREGKTTLEHFIHLYLAQVSPRKKGGAKTLENETSALNQVLEHRIASMDVYKIKKGHIIALRDTWEAKGNQENTINRKLTVLQDVFNQIQDRWLHDKLQNPVVGTKLKMPDGGDRRSNTLTPDELEAMRTALDACKSPYVRWLFDLALETAARRRELFENTWDNVKLDKGYIYIPAHLAKNRLERSIPLSPKAKSILFEMEKARPTGDINSLFPITLRAFIEAWKKSVKRSGLEDFQFRDTRHMGTTMLSRIYPRCQDLARITGHEKLETLLRYYEESIEEQVEQMANYFGNH